MVNPNITNVCFLLLVLTTGCNVKGDVCTYPVDLLLAQDISGSMQDDLKNAAVAMKSLVTQLFTTHEGSRFKVTTYTDQPLFPFGCTADDWFNDHAFRDRIEWTTDGDAVHEVLSNMKVEWGADAKEAQLLHLAHIADSKTFDKDARVVPPKLQRVIVFTSDSLFHEGGDLAKLSPDAREKYCADSPYHQCCHLEEELVIIVPYNANTDLYRHDKERGRFYFTDYPEMDFTARRLAEENISVIFLLSSDVYGHSSYTAFIKAIRDHGGYSSAVLLEESSTNLYDAVISGLQEMEGYVCGGETSGVLEADGEGELHL